MFNVQPASPFLLALEPFQAMFDYAAGHLYMRDLSMRGDGHPVLVYPGLTLNGGSTADLRVRLRQLGYAVYDWELGYNCGPGLDFGHWLAMLGRQLRDIHARHDAAVSLIGCSLGGTYARELAKRHPELVRQVITLATPFVRSDALAAEILFGKLTGAPLIGGGPTSAPPAGAASSLRSCPLPRLTACPARARAPLRPLPRST